MNLTWSVLVAFLHNVVAPLTLILAWLCASLWLARVLMFGRRK